jgi:hypothetical protein
MVQDHEQPEVEDEEGEVARNPNLDPEERIYEADEETVSEVIRKPTRAAGDLSEGGEASGRITLEELLRRVQRIEEQLGLGQSEPFDEPRPNPTELRPVSSAWPEGSQPTTNSGLERLARLAGQGETDRPEESSNPEG